MNARLLWAALAATVLFCQNPAAQADCVIAPDGKSIDVVTDNSAGEEKNCAVKCQVDTKIGVVQVSCGGNTPPLAKGHSLCAFDKPSAWYRKVISSEDTCKGGAAETSPAIAPAARADGFSCRISPDGKTVDAMIANPYATATSCQVNCQISTTNGGTYGVSCTKEVEPGAGQTVLCSHVYDKGRLVKMVSGKGDCIKPLAPAAGPANDKDDGDDDDADASKMLQNMRRQMSPEQQKIFDQMKKP